MCELQVVRVCASPGTADSDDHSRHTCSSLRLDRDQWFCQRSFRCKRPKLDFVSWPGVPSSWLALTVNLMPSGHKCTHRRRKNAPTLRRVFRTYVTGGALWEVAGSGALPPDSRARRVAVCCMHTMVPYASSCAEPVTTGAGVESVNGCKKTGLIQANSRLVGAPLQRGVPVMKTWPYSAFSCCSAPSLAAHAPPSRS